MTLLVEIASRLSSQGVGSTAAGSTGWLIVGRDLHPSTNHPRQIAIVPTGGGSQELSGDLDRRGFQVLLRGASTSSSDLEGKVNDADTALNKFRGTLLGWKYVDIHRQGDRIFVGRDEHQRPLYSLNYIAFRSQSS